MAGRGIRRTANQARQEFRRDLFAASTPGSDPHDGQVRVLVFSLKAALAVLVAFSLFSLAVTAGAQDRVGPASAPVGSPDGPATDVVVVCPPRFRAALAPWTELRGRQGYRLIFIDAWRDHADIKARIKEVSGERKLAAVVLIGDCREDAQPWGEAISATAATEPRLWVPTEYIAAKVNVQWGSEPHIATDNGYADLDGDRVPDVSVGRLPASTPEQLKAVVAKTIAYETSPPMGLGERRVNFIAGVGGFGAMADMVVEGAARYFITTAIPPHCDVTMTYGNPRSCYCPPPEKFREVTLDRLTEDSLFWVYIGHGSPYGVVDMEAQSRRYPVLCNDDLGRLGMDAGPNMPPIAVFLACYVGAYDAPYDCLAEELVTHRRGPVAVLAGSRVTMPYAMTIFGTEMLDRCFKDRIATLGEVVLAAKRRLPVGVRDAKSQRAKVDMIATLISPMPDKLPEERAEHLELFNLIGDPLLRLRYPRPIELTIRPMAGEDMITGPEATSDPLMAGAPTVRPGTVVSITAATPTPGRARVELVLRRDRSVPPDLELAGGALPIVTDPREKSYQRANDRRILSYDTTVAAGPIHWAITIPPTAPQGPYHVRLFIRGETETAAGAAPIAIAAPMIVAERSGAAGEKF